MFFVCTESWPGSAAYASSQVKTGACSTRSKGMLSDGSVSSIVGMSRGLSKKYRRDHRHDQQRPEEHLDATPARADPHGTARRSDATRTEEIEEELLCRCLRF